MLGQEEVHRLIECVTHPKLRAVLLTLYAAGLRLSEATNLKLPDIDSERMQLRIIQAKGHKNRFTRCELLFNLGSNFARSLSAYTAGTCERPLSQRLLAELRAYWKHDRPKNHLFPVGANALEQIGRTTSTSKNNGYRYGCCGSISDQLNGSIDAHR